MALLIFSLVHSFVLGSC